MGLAVQCAWCGKPQWDVEAAGKHGPVCSKNPVVPAVRQRVLQEQADYAYEQSWAFAWAFVNGDTRVVPEVPPEHPFNIGGSLAMFEAAVRLERLAAGVHASDCATNGGPAEPPGPCSCGAVVWP